MSKVYPKSGPLKAFEDKKYQPAQASMLYQAHTPIPKKFADHGKVGASYLLYGVGQLVPSFLKIATGGTSAALHQLFRHSAQEKQDRYRNWLDQVKTAGDKNAEAFAGPKIGSTFADRTEQVDKKQQTFSILQNTAFSKSVEITTINQTPAVKATLKALRTLIDSPSERILVKGKYFSPDLPLNYEEHQKKFHARFEAAWKLVEKPKNETERACRRLLSCYGAGMYLGQNTYNREYSSHLLALARSLGKHGKLEDTKEEPPLTSDEIYHRLKEIAKSKTSRYARNKLEIDSNRLKGDNRIGFNPVYNPPHCVAHLQVKQLDGEFKRVEVIRMGTPTREGQWGGFTDQAKVTGAFKSFLQHQTRLGKTHLGVILQRNSDSEGATTAARINALRKNGHWALLLPMDGDLYNAKGIFAKDPPRISRTLRRKKITSPSWKLYKDFALTEMLQSEKYSLNDPNKKEKIINREELERIFNQVKNTVCPNTEILDTTQRKQIIQLVYREVIKLALIKTGADSVDLTCKDGIDRGATMTRMLLTDACDGSSSLTEQEKEAIGLIYVSGSWATKNYVPIPGRHARMTQVDEFTETRLVGDDLSVQCEQLLFYPEELEKRKIMRRQNLQEKQPTTLQKKYSDSK